MARRVVKWLNLVGIIFLILNQVWKYLVGFQNNINIVEKYAYLKKMIQKTVEHVQSAVQKEISSRHEENNNVDECIHVTCNDMRSRSLWQYVTFKTLRFYIGSKVVSDRIICTPSKMKWMEEKGITNIHISSVITYPTRQGTLKYWTWYAAA